MACVRSLGIEPSDPANTALRMEVCASVLVIDKSLVDAAFSAIDSSAAVKISSEIFFVSAVSTVGASSMEDAMRSATSFGVVSALVPKASDSATTASLKSASSSITALMTDVSRSCFVTETDKSAFSASAFVSG